MFDPLDDPVIQTALFPLVLALLATGPLLLVRRRWAGAAIGLAVLATFALIIGWPAFPPASAMARLAWAVAAGLVLGLAVDATAATRRTRLAAAGAWLLASLAWLAWPALRDGLAADLARAVLLLAAAALVLSQMARHDDDAATPTVALGAAALAVGGVAWLGASGSIAQLAFALAAAAGGLLLWNWPRPRHGLGTAGLIGGGGMLLLLVTVLAFFSRATVAALLLALPLFLADRLRDRLRNHLPWAGGPAGTVVLGLLSLVPALAAIGAAMLAAPAGPSPY